ncbi:hypothetical protein [Streptomyces sp. SBT349]|uniref:hypothetical protein n=1 Tax=Streptomyces sp. SBT349 TaxID=1580539 RepID=UPI00066E7FE8|nr:hypothetical protein [Streptomyces sp. SBT349]
MDNDTTNDFVTTTLWQVPGRADQRAAADAAMARWRVGPWPEGCLSVTALLSTDGGLVLFSARWRDLASADAPWEGALAEARAVAEVEPLETLKARPAEAFAWREEERERPEEGPFPGCTVYIVIGTAGPAEQAQVAETIAGHVAGTPNPAGIGGQLLFTLDGTRVINWAEWTSEEAHREAVGAPALGGARGIFDGMEGIEGLRMNRFQRYRALRPRPAETPAAGDGRGGATPAP